MSDAKPRDWRPMPISDVPDHLILFDGVCVLCSRWVNFILARDKEARFRFAAIQTPYGRALAERLGINPDDPESNGLIIDGTAYFKSDSVIEALVRLPRWKWVRLGYILPKRVRDFLYDRVAKNRYQLFGRRESCLMPTPDIRRRFLSDLGETRA
jgi:predicted DCC family thiol-disulfide oxidoreductase YuxK